MAEKQKLIDARSKEMEQQLKANGIEKEDVKNNPGNPIGRRHAYFIHFVHFVFFGEFYLTSTLKICTIK